MIAVIDKRVDADVPDVYVFNTTTEAQEFVDWLVDTDPDNDGTDEWGASVPITTIFTSIPPDHWNKAL